MSHTHATFARMGTLFMLAVFKLTALCGVFTHRAITAECPCGCRRRYVDNDFPQARVVRG